MYSRSTQGSDSKPAVVCSSVGPKFFQDFKRSIEVGDPETQGHVQKKQKSEITRSRVQIPKSKNTATASTEPVRPFTTPVRNKSFSPTEPVIIELFAGTGRVTACLKALGLNQSCGIDRIRCSNLTTLYTVDLSNARGQQLVLQWLRHPLVRGFFAAPPCGTCSLARMIPLPIRRGPKPLRSRKFPEGFHNLRGTSLLRVKSANAVYEFLQQAIAVGIERNLIMAIKNLRSSLFWRTRFWLKHAGHFKYVAHQACAYGSTRPKWTAIAFNRPVFASLSKTCPGITEAHPHEPWGVLPKGHRNTFATSLETAYPPKLALAIAECFVLDLISAGWRPDERTFQRNDRLLRAIVNHQPKAARFAHAISEHRACYVVRGPTQHMSPPCQPMQRLQTDWVLPPSLTAKVPLIPKYSQLLRATPLRLRGETDKTRLDDDLTAISEQAWGVPWTPAEFVEQAVKAGHPKLIDSFLPEILQSTVDKLAASSDFEVASNRLAWIKRWSNRSQDWDLKRNENLLKRDMPPHMRPILESKRLLLWKEILIDLKYPDLAVTEEVINGVDLLGEVPTTGVFPESFKPASITLAQANEESKAYREKVFAKTCSSGCKDMDKVVWQKTLDEVNRGWVRGPVNASELPDNALVGHRFGLKQGEKVRLIDDLTMGGQNLTVQAAESPKPFNTDVIGALLLGLMKKMPSEALVGRSYDLKSAYKQMALSEESLKAPYVACHNPHTNRPAIFQLLAVPFGATRSVFAFLRVVKSLWFIGAVGLCIPWSVFFDDFVAFSKQGLKQSTDFAICSLFKLLGWQYDEDGEKSSIFSPSIKALGIEICLADSLWGRVTFANTEKRKQDLRSLIEAILSKNSITCKEGQVLRGKLQFAQGQLYGRLGRLCLNEISRLCNPGKHKIDKNARAALQRYLHHLVASKPRSIDACKSRAMYIFTDACYDATHSEWPCGIGGVLVSEQGALLEYFSYQLTESEMNALGAETKKTIIFEAELLAVVVATSRWATTLKHKPIVYCIDNNGARDVGISAKARSAVASLLLERLLKLEDSLGLFAWYCRVPSPSNIADNPSRGDTEGLEHVPSAEVGRRVSLILERQRFEAGNG